MHKLEETNLCINFLKELISNMFERVFKYAGKHKKTTILSVFVIIAGVLMSVVPFFFASEIISNIMMHKNMTANYILMRIAGIFIALFLNAVLYVKGLSLSHKAAYNILMNFRTSLQRRMEKLPLGVIQEKGIGSLKRLFVDDVENLESLLAHAIPEGIGNISVPIIVYISLFIADWKLALMSLANLPIGILVSCIMYKIGISKMSEYYKAGQIMNNTIIKYVNGMEVLKIFNKDGEVYGKFHDDVISYRDLTLNWYKACWPWMAIYNSLLPCTIFLTLPLGAWFVLQGYSNISDLILVLCLSLSIGMPILKALSFMSVLPQIDYKMSAIEKVLNVAELKQTSDKFNGKNHTIVFEDVDFAYEEQKVVDNVNLTIKEGQKTALVGESGSGKSTLSKLLVHYYDVNKGSIKIGGQDIREMSLEELNKQISYVSQEQFLFNTTLLENIRVGKLDATDEEVMEAAKKAQCLEFIEKLPDGINTMAGDSGKQLSGGQMQRISLARAILKNAPIVVLDEATAFTDANNENKIEAVISEIVKGKTLLVIAHRFSSIINADKICVMADGKISAEGKHEELLKNSKDYQRLWKSNIESSEWKVDNRREEA